jgi:hypothetical protein
MMQSSVTPNSPKHRNGSGHATVNAKVDNVKKGNPAICDEVKESTSEHKLLSRDTKPDKLPTDVKPTWAETLILSVLTHKQKSRRKPTIMSIEGIPGCGKSMTLDGLDSAYRDHPDVIILTEPVHEWESIRLRELSLMDLANRYPLKAGFAFQLFYFLVTERQLKRAYGNIVKRGLSSANDPSSQLDMYT